MITTKESSLANSTLSRLLDGAERSLFRHGYKGASIRRITQEAGANIASINYHFGSKKELFAALIQRRLNAVTQQRGELLQSIMERAEWSIDDVVRAYFGALFQIRQSMGQEVIVAIWTLLVGDSEALQLSDLPVGDSYIKLRRRYAQALASVTPGVPVGKLEWRLIILERFTLCVMVSSETCWALGSIDSHKATVKQPRESLSDGLISIIRACIQAPLAIQNDPRVVSDKSSSPGE